MKNNKRDKTGDNNNYAFMSGDFIFQRRSYASGDNTLAALFPSIKYIAVATAQSL